MTGRVFGRIVLLLGAIGSSVHPATASAQSPEPLSSVTGRVVRAAGSADLRPIPGRWVALNRVGNDSAGVIDSVRSGADGEYRFTYRRGGDPDAIYFTDVSYGGVGYFTDPFRGLNVTGDDADLIVFDTVSARTDISLLNVRGRHLVVGPRTADGRRPIVEVFELTNDTSLTVVPGADSQPVWSVALLAGAADPEVGDGDIVESVVRFRDGRAELFAPMAPGLRQLSVRYTVPEGVFPLALALPDAPEVFEVMIAGVNGIATGAGLHAEDPVIIEDQPYMRFLSQRVTPGDAARIRLGESAADRFTIPAAIGVTILVLAAALVYARRTTYSSVDN